MKKRSSPKQLDELYEALTKVETKEEAKLFLDDLLSKNELKALSGRIHSAKMFLEGKTYILYVSQGGEESKVAEFEFQNSMTGEWERK